MLQEESNQVTAPYFRLILDLWKGRVSCQTWCTEYTGEKTLSDLQIAAFESFKNGTLI